MKSIPAFFRLIRWPNLFFIGLTQVLFYYCIIKPSLPSSYYIIHDKLTDRIFFLIVIASVLIAAAGYIINDYFDINIDQVNKPDKMVVEKIISRRWAIVLHLSITLVGLAISSYVALKSSILILPANIISALMLWFYSTTFKKKLLSGNVIISLLTAWTIFVLYFAAQTTYFVTLFVTEEAVNGLNRIYKFAALYGGFAFIISLIREVIKDMEDMEGDARYNCKTMPIVWGIPASKVFVAVWLIVLVSSLAILQFYVLQFGWWHSAIYCALLIMLPCLWVLRELYKAQVSADYHKLSTAIKLIMLAGIVSMVFLKIYQ